MTRSKRPRDWAAHAVLVALLATTVLVARARHVPDEVLLRHWESGTPEERLEALFVLVRRNEPFRPTPTEVRELLESPDPRLREIAVTLDVTRGAPRRQQRQHVERLQDPAERVRCEQWLRLEKQVGARTYPHDRLVAYLEAISPQ